MSKQTAEHTARVAEYAAQREVFNTYKSLVSGLVKQDSLTASQKHDLILRPVNKEWLSNIDTTNTGWAIELINSIYDNDSDLYQVPKNGQTNAFAIATCGHDVETMEEYFEYVGADEALVLGYRQHYASVHLATDPAIHISSFLYDADSFPAIEKTLQLLEDNGADFNFRDGGASSAGMYHNPPLALGLPSGKMAASWEMSDTVRAALIKHGANPFISGSSYDGSHNINGIKLVLSSDAVNIELLKKQLSECTGDVSEFQNLLNSYCAESSDADVAMAGAGAGIAAPDMVEEAVSLAGLGTHTDDCAE